MMLIVALRKLTDKQKQNIKEHYKTIIFDKRLHLRKSIDKLQCEVLIVELDLSRVFSISKNIVLKWLKSQDISDIVTSFIYESTKYKKLFDKNVNYFVRSFPELFKKNIEESVKDKELADDNVKSKYVPPTEEELEAELRSSTKEEEEDALDLKTEIDTSALPLELKIQILEKRIDALEKLFGAPLERPKLERQDGSTQEPEILLHAETFKQPEYVLEEQNDKIVISYDGTEVQSYEYKNKIQKRKLMKKAQTYFNYLIKTPR
jgi:hypothetical protein